MKKLVYSMVMALCAIILFAGCEKSDPPARAEFTVTFSSDGGSEVKAVKVAENGKLSKPTDPTKGEFIFAGWFKESTWVNAWDFDKDVVTKDITLYAKWTTVTYTVVFNTNGGSAVAPLTVAQGSKALKPVPPTKSGVAFDNWYKEVALTNVYDFSTAVNADITLYAKWIEVTRETLQTLADNAHSINSSNYTNDSYNAMRSKLEAAVQVLQTENPTTQQIATAYAELSEAMAALVALAYKEVVDVYISNVVDGVLYVSQGESFSIYAFAESATGGSATDNRIAFKYDTAKLETWAEYGVSVSGSNLSFQAKKTLVVGATISVTITSVENPAISKTITLKVAGQGELKTMFLNAVNALPAPDKIAYQHYEAIDKAHDLYYSLPYNDQQDAAVKVAYEKLRECSDAYWELPTRIKYAFKGNVCTFTALVGTSGEEDGGEYTFVANGAFPAGTYTVNKWGPGEKDDKFYQYRIILKNDGTGAMEEREANDANGTGATEWKEDDTFTYTNQGTQAAGGMFLMTFKREMEEPNDELKPNPDVKSVRSASAVIFRMGR